MKNENEITGFINLFAVLAAIISIIIGLLMLFTLPQVVPVHFDAAFNPDRYGDKKELLFVVFLPLLPLIFAGVKINETEEKEKKPLKTAIIRLTTTLLVIGIVWIIMFSV